MRPLPLILLYAIPAIVVPLCLLGLLVAHKQSLPLWLWGLALALLTVNLAVIPYLIRHQIKSISHNANDATPDELLIAINDANIGYVVLNNDCEILFASQSANLLLGFSETAAITGRVLYELDHDSLDMKTTRKRAWNDYVQHRSPWNGIVRWVSASGEKSYYDYTFCSVNDERIILVIIDRSDSIKATRTLQEQEKQHNYILNNMPISITLHDTEQKIIYTNSYLASRLGLDVEQMIGKMPRDVLPKATVTAVHEMYTTVLRTRNPVEEVPVSVTEGEISGTEWLMYVYPVFLNGKIEQLLIIGLDRTERARLAREKEEFARKLFETQKVEALNKFAGGLAHELSNLLHPAGVYARALKEDPDLRDREKYLSRINTAVMKSGEIIRRTLSMSRSDKDGPKPVDLAAFLQDLVDYASDIAPTRLSYDFLKPDHPIHGLANETELRQVMMNLLINAAHAQDNAGVILITLGYGGVPSANVSLAPKTAGPFVWIDVTDTGTGIEPEIRQQIFEPFFTTKREGDGTGLGLSVVQGIVTGWGGLVSVDSAPGKGSTFRVWIPAALGVQAEFLSGGTNDQNTGY